jgi:periplasmic protein TonB
MTWLRFPVAFALSLVLTTGLFGFMRVLTNSRSEAGEAAAITKFEFVRLRRSESIEAKKREKPEVEKAEQAPVAPTLAVAEEQGVSVALDVQALASGLGAEFGSAGGRGRGGGEMGGPGFSSGLADRAALPLVRVDPQYPPQAQRQKLEGWVQVKFTLTTAGSVKDPTVVKSSSEIFEKNAVQAVSKWKYQPQLKAGKPVEVANKQVMVRFQLPKG